MRLKGQIVIYYHPFFYESRSAVPVLEDLKNSSVVSLFICPGILGLCKKIEAQILILGMISADILTGEESMNCGVQEPAAGWDRTGLHSGQGAYRLYNPGTVQVPPPKLCMVPNRSIPFRHRLYYLGSV
jgi:hypothetical protein